MKHGEWSKEWKTIQKDLESALKKAKPGMVFEKVYEKEVKRKLKPVEKTLAECDLKYKKFYDTDPDKGRDVLKEFASAQDDYQSTCADMRKGFKALQKITDKSDPAISKVLRDADAGCAEIDKSLGNAVIGLTMSVEYQNREKKKVANVSKDLGKAYKDMVKFCNTALGDKTGKHYLENAEKNGQELSDLLIAIDKMVRKKPDLDDKKAPPKSMISEALCFSDKKWLDCTGKDGEFDPAEMKKNLGFIIRGINDIEKWRKKTWPK